MTTFPRSSVMTLLSDLGVEDPEAVFQVTIDVGHVTVRSYERDQLDGFVSKGERPSVLTAVYPVDVNA